MSLLFKKLRFLNLFVQYNNTFTVFISKFVPLFMKNLKITAKNIVPVLLMLVKKNTGM